MTPNSSNEIMKVIQLDRSTDTREARIEYANSRIVMRLRPSWDFDSFTMFRHIQLAKPVKFKSVQILHGVESLECFLQNMDFIIYTSHMVPGKPVNFSEEGVSDFATSAIFCHTENYKVYSKI